MKKIILILFVAFGIVCYGQKDTINAKNAEIFFKNLGDKGGVWTYTNEKFDANNKNDFSHFVMEFKTDEFGALEGTISGINAQKQKMVFWKVLEFVDPFTGNIVFIQRGRWGYAVALSSFKEKNIRNAEFELTYSNGTKEKHKDVHTLLDDNTILTESDLFDAKTKKWKKQPSQKWKRKL